jgi:type II secretory pathway component PulF
MKGIAVETVLYAIVLVVALVLITIVFMKLIPAFGKFVDAAMSGIKNAVCGMLPWYSKWLLTC